MLGGNIMNDKSKDLLKKMCFVLEIVRGTCLISVALLRQLPAIFIHLYEKTSRCAVTTGILYDLFNACTILLTLSM